MNELNEWINLNQLSILGINEAYVFTAIMLCGLFIIYLIVEPICSWLIISGSSKTISYFMSTLIMLILLMGFLLLTDPLQPSAHHLFKAAFISNAIFGIVLSLYHFIRIKLFLRHKKAN